MLVGTKAAAPGGVEVAGAGGFDPGGERRFGLVLVKGRVSN